VGLGGFEAVAHGDLLPPLPTTTVTVPPTLPPLPTSTTVPLPPITTATVRLPTTTTVPVPTTTVRVPPTTTTVRLPTTTLPPPLPTSTVHLPTTTTATVPPRLPTVTSSAPAATSTSALARGAAPLAAPSGGGPPSGGAAAANQPGGSLARPARAGNAPLTRISGPALEALKGGARPARPKAHVRTRAGTTLPVIHAARVSARTPGLAAFYAGLEKALANDTTSVVDGGTTPQFLWPAAAADGGVLSRTGALMLAIALFALALVLAFSLLPRLAAIGFLPLSRTTAQAARESSLVAVGAITVCALLAILLLRIAL
jgi:hypothetical protein